MKAIELKNLSFNYNGYVKKILSNVNFEVNYGEVALLSGCSGEGKSTLLSLICGIIPNIINGDVDGDVLIDSVSIKGKKLSEVCRRVGIVLQNADNQIIHKIVEDEIAFGCENFAIPEDKISEQIDRVCTIMEIDKTRQTRTLSGGQKQRLITASTLATGQKILVLDEPLANLDGDSAKLLMDTLCQLADAGYAVLVSEHRIDMVLPYVDSVWNICSGKVVKVQDKQNYLKSQIVQISDGLEKCVSDNVLFKINHLAFSIKKHEILKDIDFKIYKGERLLLLGENGTGKTILLRLLARLHMPTKGNIEQNLFPKLSEHYHGKKWFKRVGIVYQNPNYQLFMPTVQKEIEFNAQSKEYTSQIMEMFGLEHLKNRHPQSLSEGQKRRVSIAAVVAGNPEVLLLDEPTVGQDYKGLCELVKILNELHKKNGNTMVTITHDMRCAEALCDRAILIENGIVAQQGDKDFVCRYFMKKSEKSL